jgi:hypothetical protein
MEALVAAMSRSEMRDRPAVLEAVHTIVQAAAELPSNQLRWGVLDPILLAVLKLLEHQAELSLHQRYQAAGLNANTVTQILKLVRVLVVQVDGDAVAWRMGGDQRRLTHLAMEALLPAIVSALGRHELDMEIQSLGIDVLLQLAGHIPEMPQHDSLEEKEMDGMATRRKTVGAGGGVQAAVQVMLNFPRSVQMQILAARSLYLFAHNEPVNRVLITELGGMQLVLTAMNAYQNEARMQENGLRLLLKIAWNEPAGQGSIVEAGGVEVMLRGMRSHIADAAVQRSACFAILSLVRTRNQFERNALLRAGALPAVKRAVKVHGKEGGVMMACTVVQQMLVRASESLNEPLHNSGHASEHVLLQHSGNAPEHVTADHTAESVMSPDDDLARLATRASSRELQPQEAEVPKKEKQKKEASCTIGFWKPR